MDLQTRYETAEKEQKIDLLQRENQIQQLENSNNRLLLIVLVIIISVIVFMGIILYRQNKLRTEQHVQSLQQKMLRLQMNPHFIFNAMGAILEYIYDKEPLKAGSYLSNFSRLFRFILESSNKDYISLSEEIEMLEYYVQLQKLRFKESFDYSFEIDETIEPDVYYLPPMLLQPFVENAIEHGLRKLNSGGMITIAVIKQDNVLLIEIMDNGIGIYKSLTQTKGKYAEHKSMAINITRERLQLFNKRKKTNIRFEIKEHLEGGTIVIFNIPVKYN
ncbi:MAG: histidine kinase [Bacteroidota bacterium]